MNAAILCVAWTGALANALPAGPAAQSERGEPRPRAREIGLTIGVLSPGPLNAITDVAGVRVGHRTIIEGEDIRTGVTAIHPHPGNVFQRKAPAAIAVGNGFGKLIGVTQVNELGTLETPIVLTNTLSVFAAADALVEWMLSRDGNEDVRSINPVVGETNDGYLNDIRRRAVTRDDVFAALDSATGGAVQEGSVGAGTGTRCFGFKGGIGTSSRRLTGSAGAVTVGVLVQSNFGGVLQIDGAPVGEVLGGHAFAEVAESATVDGGSCMIVVATDAPLDARQLGRLARRALLGLAGVGSSMSHSSGDYVIAFSTAAAARPGGDLQNDPQRHAPPADTSLTPLFQAAREATEEAIVNSLLAATTVKGFRGRTVEAISVERVIEICRRHGAIPP